MMEKRQYPDRRCNSPCKLVLEKDSGYQDRRHGERRRKKKINEKMKCPKCGDRRSMVCGDGKGTKRSYIDYSIDAYVRDRKCLYCGNVFSTIEYLLPA